MLQEIHGLVRKQELMARILIFSIVLLGFRLEGPPPADSLCALCVGHHGTCGCDFGHVVCCDGYDAYGCGCR